MEAPKTIEEIGKYLNEILGYLLPGIFANLVLFLISDFNQIPQLKDKLLFNPWIFLVLSYIVGYLIYGISQFKDKIFSNFYERNKKNKLLCLIYNIFHKIKVTELPNLYIKRIVNKISKSGEYIFTRNKLKQMFPEFVTDDINFNALRSLAMSYCPEYDQKIYTFMFRSELCNHIGTVCFIVSIWIFISIITKNYWNNTLLIKNGIIERMYVPLILSFFSYSFYLTKKRFYEIAYKIVFSIFVSKSKPLTIN